MGGGFGPHLSGGPVIHATPLNDHFMGPAGSTAWQGAVTLTAFNQRTVSVVLDVMLLDESTFNLTDKLIFGSDLDTNWWFEVDVPAAGVSVERTIRFNTKRNTVVNSSEGTIEVAKRYVLCGIDDGTNVRLYINGEAQTPSSDWTAAEASYPIVQASIAIANDPTALQSTLLRLYEAMVRRNGEVIMHFVPRPGQSGAVLEDLSEYGNDLAIPSPSDYVVRTVWDREPAFGGSEVIAWP